MHLRFRSSALSAQLSCCPQDGLEHEVDALLRRKFENRFKSIDIVNREDLDLVRPLDPIPYIKYP